MRTYKFFYHFNKPLTRQRGKPYMSVHFRGKCYFTPDLICRVPCQTKVNKRQPIMVMEGKCNELHITGSKIEIV